MSRRSVIVGAVGLLAVGAVAVGAAFSSAAPIRAVPAAPPTSGTTTTVEGYTYNPADRDITRRLAAGEDPAGIPGVRPATGEDGQPPAQSSPENEARLAKEAYEAGVTYETNAGDLPSR